MTKIIQEGNRRSPRSRSELLDSMEAGFREISTTGIMLHQAVATRLGLYITDHKCVGMLAEFGPLSAGKLAELTGLTTGAITGVLNRLEKAGYAKRVLNPEDRRNVRVEPRNLTKFNKRMEELLGPLRSKMRSLSSKYSTGELELVLDFMKASVAISHEETERLKSKGRQRLRSVAHIRGVR